MDPRSLTELGEVIAERVFHVEGPDGARREVVALLGRPQPTEDHYYCPYQLTGIDRARLGVPRDAVHCAFGVDTLQALVNALHMVAAELYTSAEAEAGTLTWLDDRDLQVPLPDQLRDLKRTATH